jgi:hypothetical protein
MDMNAYIGVYPCVMVHFYGYRPFGGMGLLYLI